MKRTFVTWTCDPAWDRGLLNKGQGCCKTRKIMQIVGCSKVLELCNKVLRQLSSVSRSVTSVSCQLEAEVGWPFQRISLNSWYPIVIASCNWRRFCPEACTPKAPWNSMPGCHRFAAWWSAVSVTSGIQCARASFLFKDSYILKYA